MMDSDNTFDAVLQGNDVLDEAAYEDLSWPASEKSESMYRAKQSGCRQKPKSVNQGHDFGQAYISRLLHLSVPLDILMKNCAGSVLINLVFGFWRGLITSTYHFDKTFSCNQHCSIYHSPWELE